MPYVGRTLSKIILLPKEKDGLPRLESRLNPENLKTWTSGLSSQRVRVFFPKFKMTQSLNLEENLRKMGMEQAFTGQADFSGIEPKKELFISAVIHKAFIAVDEKGTEAAAATAVAMLAMAAPPLEEPPEFRADHPFLFFIRDNRTGSILFLGRLLDPNT
jgi:serpin B